MNAQDLRNHVAKQCGFTPNKAKPYALQVCNAGAMPESFEDWLKANEDAIELDRTEATCKWFDELPTQEEQRARWDAEQEAQEHENDLRWESLMADESEYGPINNQQGENL